jgi:hypothetical protein
MQTTDFVKFDTHSCEGCYFTDEKCRQNPLPKIIKDLDKIHGNCCGRTPHIYVTPEKLPGLLKAQEISDYAVVNKDDVINW